MAEGTALSQRSCSRESFNPVSVHPHLIHQKEMFVEVLPLREERKRGPRAGDFIVGSRASALEILLRDFARPHPRTFGPFAEFLRGSLTLEVYRFSHALRALGSDAM